MLSANDRPVGRQWFTDPQATPRKTSGVATVSGLERLEHYIRHGQNLLLLQPLCNKPKTE
jgi:hypothetical protein